MMVSVASTLAVVPLGEWTPLGCYADAYDANGRVVFLNGLQQWYNPNQTLESCGAFCTGNRYFFTEFGSK
jgi:hypothetical protein